MNDIEFKIGSVNPSGIGDEVYFIQKHLLRRWPTINDDLEFYDEGFAEYQGDFVPHTGCVWTRLYNTQGKGKIRWESRGERDCMVVVNIASMVYPHFNADIAAFSKYAANGDCVFVIKHDSKYYVVGNSFYRAALTPSGDSGDTAGSAKGVNISIECPDTTPLPTYTGKLFLTDGIIDCENNTFINYNDMNTNELKDYSSQIEGGNSVRFEAIGRDGRMHLEGTGDILFEVSVDGVNYEAVEHSVEFENGVAEAPIAMYIGDHVRISATTLTVVKINYNNIKIY